SDTCVDVVARCGVLNWRLYTLRSGSGTSMDRCAVLRARHSRIDGIKRGMSACRGGPLCEAVISVAPHRHSAVRPSLSDQPVKRVPPVIDLVDEQQRTTLGAELSPDVLGHDPISARHAV